jgi:hypothetical protein
MDQRDDRRNKLTRQRLDGLMTMDGQTFDGLPRLIGPGQRYLQRYGARCVFSVV